MDFINLNNEVKNINNTNSTNNNDTNSNPNKLNFLEYITTPRNEVSYEDIEIQEKLLEVLEELEEQNEENLFDNLVNNMVDYYTNEDNVNSIKEETIDKLAEVVDQLEHSHWFKL